MDFLKSIIYPGFVLKEVIMFFKKKQKSSFLDKYIRGGYLPASSGVNMKQFVAWIKYF